jgi:glycosyltransferase involved in cell wall biosynthesis
MAARLTGAAAIVQLAGGALEIESGGWEGQAVRIPAFLIRHLVPLCRSLCSCFDAVVVRGRKTEAYVRQHSRPGRVLVIPGTVNPERFVLQGWQRHIDIAFIGRIVGLKQPDHICEVVSRVARRRPGLRVVVAGRGPLLEKMKRDARELGLGKVIRFVGHVEKVEGLLGRSRLFLLTSRSEGLSIALAEAMAAGAVPVVADVGDLSELVVNGKTGWLIPPGDFDAYADRICALLDNQESWLIMSTNARQLALENNGVASAARRWQECLDEIAAAPGGRAGAAAPLHDIAA